MNNTSSSKTNKRAAVRKQDRPGEPVKGGTGGSFAATERQASSVSTLSNNQPILERVPSLKGGFATLTDEDFAKMQAMSADELIELCEMAPANTPGLPGPINANNSEIARELLYHEILDHARDGLEEIDSSGSTGSWGSRSIGEGSVRYYTNSVYNATRSGEYDDERDAMGTMTWAEFEDGNLIGESGVHGRPGWTTVAEVDIDFKAVIQEQENNGTLNEFLLALEEVWNEQEKDRFRRGKSDTLRTRGSDAA